YGYLWQRLQLVLTQPFLLLSDDLLGKALGYLPQNAARLAGAVVLLLVALLELVQFHQDVLGKNDHVVIEGKNRPWVMDHNVRVETVGFLHCLWRALDRALLTLHDMAHRRSLVP